MDGGAWKAAVHGVAEGQTWLSDFTFTFHFHALEKEMATHSSVLAWRIPGTGGAWWAAVYGVAQSRTRPKRFSSSSSKSIITRDQPEVKLQTSIGSLKKQESSRKTSTSALLTMPKPLCGSQQTENFLKRWEYQTTWPACWETCMQVRKQQLELVIEQQTGSK